VNALKPATTENSGGDNIATPKEKNDEIDEELGAIEKS
jgi:hypothetical protein